MTSMSRMTRLSCRRGSRSPWALQGMRGRAPFQGSAKPLVHGAAQNRILRRKARISRLFWGAEVIKNAEKILAAAIVILGCNAMVALAQDHGHGGHEATQPATAQGRVSSPKGAE